MYTFFERPKSVNERLITVTLDRVYKRFYIQFTLHPPFKRQLEALLNYFQRKLLVSSKPERQVEEESD